MGNGTYSINCHAKDSYSNKFDAKGIVVWGACVGMSSALQLIMHKILQLCFSRQESRKTLQLVRAEDWDNAKMSKL